MTTKRQNIYFISDIHIAMNENYNWYKSPIHEEYLSSTLNTVLADLDAIELVILGDLVDFWTTPIDKAPPSVDDIIGKNPAILGANGLLSEIAKRKKLSYVNGNHDMEITASTIQRLIPGVNYIDSGVYEFKHGERTIIGMHGHTSSLFNAPIFKEQRSVYQNFPLGYLVTRLSATIANNKGNNGNLTERDLAESNNPLVPAFLEAEFEKLLRALIWKYFMESPEVGDGIAHAIIHTLAHHAGVKMHDTITLPDGNKVTLEDAVANYSDIVERWITFYNKSLTRKALDFTDTACELNWITKDEEARVFWGQHKTTLAAMGWHDIAVMGHTHKPAHHAHAHTKHPAYWNSGFNCPTAEEMEHRRYGKHVTFLKVTATADGLEAAEYKILKDDDGCKPYPL